ncbi:MAG: hypothetical protein DRP12_03000, partial [Candidatus Aenigmatarchaeota archaeon]
EAKKAGIWNPKQTYGPKLVILGKRMILPQLEEELKKLKPGEEKQVELKNPFGERRPELIKIISLSHFLKNKINPIPGMPIEIEGVPARVQAVSGGRVRVDFNHPLAGKTVIYRLKVVKKLENLKEKAEALIKHFGISGEVVIQDQKPLIKLEKEIPEKLKKAIQDLLPEVGFTTKKA